MYPRGMGCGALLRGAFLSNPGPLRNFPAVQRLGNVPPAGAQACTPSFFTYFLIFFKLKSCLDLCVSASLPGEGGRQVGR